MYYLYTYIGGGIMKFYLHYKLYNLNFYLPFPLSLEELSGFLHIVELDFAILLYSLVYIN